MSIDTIFAHTIVEIIRNKDGEITAYKLDNGETILEEEAFALAKQGVIKAIEISNSKNGEEHLTHLPAGDGNSNLGNLPIINVDKK